MIETHEGHEKHLCWLTLERRMDEVAKLRMDEVAKLTKDAKYMCFVCGRVAANAENLCEPVQIED
jgi:hypothetical protein